MTADVEIDEMMNRLDVRNRAWKGLRWVYLSSGIVLITISALIAYYQIYEIWLALEKLNNSVGSINRDRIGPDIKDLLLAFVLFAVGAVMVVKGLINWSSSDVERIMLAVWRREKVRNMVDGA